ncbi:TPA: hypothetical protein ACHJ3C_004574 [Pseudomonas aeruginosa]|nr:hypothetical protein [Pseudomonas aeruginosa]
MNRSHIVHGPTGCGKTRNAERIAAALGLSKVQDNWTPTGQVFEPFDTLYLTASNGPWPDQARHVLSFSEAMWRVPDAVVEPKGRYIHRNGVEYEVVMIANGESTCPSGDGSLRWPCPKHPAVEQAGGDERAAFESRAEDAGSDISRDDFGNYVNVYVQTEWEGWQARAALAQPSPASDLDPLNLAPHAEAFNEAPAEALKPGQAEAERPEVVAVMESNGAGGKRLAQRFPIVNVFVGDELMTVAQHERIAAQLHDALDESDGDRWKLRSERDAAMARVAEYEAQAQHSVPGNAAALVRAEAKKYSLNAAGMLDSGAPEHAQTFAIVQLLSEFDDEEAERHWEAIMAYSDFRTSDALFRAAELLAAAPGKEGV